MGTPWVTDYAGMWRSLGLPVGSIEGGKAIAAELWLDPLRDGWSTPYIAGVARSEFYYRPLGGSYELEIEAGSHIRLERLERVQLLLGSTYWVAQQ